MGKKWVKLTKFLQFFFITAPLSSIFPTDESLFVSSIDVLGLMRILQLGPPDGKYT